MPNQRIIYDARHMAKGLDMRSARNLAYGAISDGNAMRYIKDTGIYTGPGYFRMCDLGSSARVDDLFGAANETLKSLWAKSGTKIYHNVHNENPNPYDIGLTLTATERQAFLEVRNGDILTFNQTDAPSRVALAVLTAAVTDLTTGSMTVGAGNIDKFAASGTVYAKGVSYTYSGKSATALTGLGGGPLPTGGLAVGDLISQTSQPTTMANQKGTSGMFLEGSTLIAGVKGREDVIYASAVATFDNPEYAYDFDGHGASAKVMPNAVVGMIKGSTLGYIFGHRWVESTSGFDVETGILNSDPVSPDYGAYNARCIVNMGGRIAFMGEGRLIPITITLNQFGVSIGKPDEDFDAPIRPWLERFDPSSEQTDVACLNFDLRQGLLNITGAVDGNIETRCYQTLDGIKAFTPTEARPVRCYAFFDGNTYFGDNSQDLVYKNNVTRTNNGFAILHSCKTGWLESYQRTGKRGKMDVMSDFLEFDGYMSAGLEFTVNIYTEGNQTTPAYSIDLDDSLIDNPVGVAIGTKSVGTTIIGGGDSTPDLAFHYSCHIDLNGLSSGQYMIEWVTVTEAGFLQIESYVMEGDGLQLTQNDAQ